MLPAKIGGFNAHNEIPDINMNPLVCVFVLLQLYRKIIFSAPITIQPLA